jgi:prophage regulatory protein
MNEQQLGKRLDGVRRDLDEIAEQLARILTQAPAPAAGEELVGQMEIGRMVGFKSSTVGVWVGRGKLPPPVAELACGRVWRKSDIEAWIRRTKRLGHAAPN